MYVCMWWYLRYVYMSILSPLSFFQFSVCPFYNSFLNENFYHFLTHQLLRFSSPSHTLLFLYLLFVSVKTVNSLSLSLCMSLCVPQVFLQTYFSFLFPNFLCVVFFCLASPWENTDKINWQFPSLFVCNSLPFLSPPGLRSFLCPGS